MSEALYELGGLRFWTEQEILIRDQATQSIKLALSTALCSLNAAWTFHRVDGPLLTPRAFISPSYDEGDIFLLRAKLGDDEGALRAETTASSYLYAKYLMQNGKAKLPTCIWQAGKSFRRETMDGARASTLRYNEFYQLEFQCIYSNTTKADVRATAMDAVEKEIAKITQRITRISDSDRLPSYSQSTLDIEVDRKGSWKEMASVSIRTDFPQDNVIVVEAAVGLDRLVAVARENET
jgi:glycyl-tRNA synthetase